MITVERGYTDCRLGQLHYLRGRPDAAPAKPEPPLVLLHQNPSSSLEYENLLREMARGREVIAFDTPGYGNSDPPPKPLSMAGYAECFSDALDRLDPAHGGMLDVFGFHTGSLLAAELGLQRPDRVRRLVLSGIPMRTRAECADRLAEARATKPPTDDGAAILAKHAALWRYVVSERTPGMTLTRACALFAEKSRTIERDWWAYEGVWSYPFAERLPLITQPTLVLQPHDALLAFSRAACALIPRGVFIDLPDLDRDIFDVGVERLSHSIQSFLAAETEI